MPLARSALPTLGMALAAAGCLLARIHRPDGSVSKVGHRKTGEAGFTPVTASHSFENVG